MELLTSGAELSEEDLQGIDGICAGVKESLGAEGPQGTTKFPGSQWVFHVERTQYAALGIDAKDYTQAHHKACAYLHGNIEALRFTWDRSDPLTLSVIKLHREPVGTNDP